MTGAVHRYRTHLEWSGSTGAGYREYGRAHRGWAVTDDGPVPTGGDPAHRSGVDLTADPAFRGDPGALNPEQLVVLAASSCQLLSFLAVAARGRIDVVAYVDEAEGVMPTDDPPLRLTAIVLHPVITVRPHADGPDHPDRPTDDRLRHLVEVGHRECFIARSLATEVEVDPRFVRSA